MVVLAASIVLVLLMLLIGTVVLMSEHTKSANRSFFVLVVNVSFWAMFFVISNYSSRPLFYVKMTDVFGLLGSLSLLYFSLIYPNGNHKITTVFSLLISCVVSFILIPITLLTPMIVADVKRVANTSTPTLGSYAWVYFSIVLACLLLGSMVLLFKYVKTYRKDTAERQRLKFVVVGLGVTATIIALMNAMILFFGSSIDWFIDALTPFSVIIFISFTSYGILKGGLFDIRLAIVRSATYSLLIATLASIYAGSTFAISSIFEFGQSTPAQIISNAAISLILVFLFQPLRKFFDRVTSKIFYKDNYSSDEFFGRLNNTLAITTDLRELLERAASEISTTLKSSHAFFHVFASNDEQHISSGTTNHTDLSNDTATRIKKYITKNSKIIVALLLDEKEELKRTLLADKIEIVLPLIKDGKVIGFLCLGENMRSNYTDRDIVVLDAISSGLVIAIQNALAVQEIRDFNITLRKRIDEATEELRVKNSMLRKLDKAKDEFVSMASHQLRTPLTSVKGYLSMVVDGDAGVVTNQQKDLLNQAYASNERMVTLVNDFLNVSRIQTGKFVLDKKTIDLSKLVDEEVKGLIQNATKRQIKLDYKAPTAFPTIEIDEGKLRQVVMNFIDNAIYYSNVDSTIEINLAIENNKAIFTVKDTGIGVPASEQAGLFTKFYRASNAKKQRPDGTGVGLYLAKRIVTDHGGEIIFKTVEGKGSTFGFSLPVKK